MRTPLLVTALLTIAVPALAQTTPSGEPDSATTAPPGEAGAPAVEQQGEEKPKDKKPKRGDFNAGGQLRLPNGPDEMDQFATFNWVALDVKGKYYLLDSVTADGVIPLAVKKPDMLSDGSDPKLIGGVMIKLDARLPMPKKVPITGQSMEGNEVGVTVGGAYMHEGAMLLSEKDYPKFVGDFQPGFLAGITTKVKLSSLVDFKLLPTWVYQKGTAESLTAVQIPMSLILALGNVVKVSADLGIYTGDDYTFRSSKGGRVALGAALDVKLGPILTHLGAGSASLGTGGLYPTISDSVYIDLNVKYAK
jgi:hypothetical protein